MWKYQVTEVHKVAGRLDSQAQVVTLPPLASRATDRKALGKILREARLLAPGQSIAEVRHTRECWAEFTVFPNNAPGLTTGTHALLFKAID